MLRKPLFPRPLVLGARVLVGVLVASCSLDIAFAQSPAARGVYNTATQFSGNPAGFAGAPSQLGSGVFGGANNASFGAGFSGMGGAGMESGLQNSSKLIEPQDPVVVDEPEYIYRGHDEKEPILSVEFLSFNNGNGYAVLSGSGDTTVKLWALEGKYDSDTTEWFVTKSRLRKEYKDVHKQGVTKALFSPDFSYVLTSSYDGAGRLWNFGNKKNIRAYLPPKQGANTPDKLPMDRLWSIDVSPSGDMVAAARDDGRICFWEPLSVKALGYLPNSEDAENLGAGFEGVGHKGPVYDVSFSPDGMFVATAGADGTIRIWNIARSRQVAVLEGHTDKVYSVKFSESGSYLLSASRDKTARMWDPNTNKEVCRFIGHTGSVRKALFAGSCICTASDDGTVRLWNPQFTSSTGQDAQSNLSGLGMGSSTMNPEANKPTISPMMSLDPSGKMNPKVEENVAKPTRAPGKPKGVELAIFEAGSPVFDIDVTGDFVYVCGGCADGAVRIWRIPGQGRYYGDSQGSMDFNYDSSESGFGTDPLANPDNILPPSGSATPMMNSPMLTPGTNAMPTPPSQM